MQGDPRRDLAADARLAGHAVHLHRRAERRAPVAADRHEDVGLAAGARPRSPRRSGRARRSTAPSWLRPGRPGVTAGGACAGARRSSPERGSDQQSSVQFRHPSHVHCPWSSLLPCGLIPDNFRTAAAAPNCQLRGSPTAVIWLNVGDGLAGYAPAPKLVLRASLVRPVGQVEHLGQRLELDAVPPSRNARLTRRLSAEELVAHAGVARDELAVDDRPAGRALHGRHARGDVERRRRVGLQHAAQLEAVRQVLPGGGRRRHRRVDAARDHQRDAAGRRRTRPQSFDRSNGSIGELKKNSPTLFIGLRQRVADAVVAPRGRPLRRTTRAGRDRSTRRPTSTGCCWRRSGFGRQPLLVPAATHDGTFWLIDISRLLAAHVLSSRRSRVPSAPTCRSISTLAWRE